MFDGNIPVSLSEVVEVRGTGLAEDEAWALLSKFTKPLQILVTDARSSQVQDCSLSADTVFLLPTGNLELKCMHKAGLEDLALPPEYGSDVENNNQDFMDLSKIFIFSFGAIVLNCIRTSESSQELLSLLNLMTVRDARIRPSIPKLQQLTQKEVAKKELDCGDVVRSLYSVIMGSFDQGVNVFRKDEFLPNGSLDRLSDHDSSSVPASPLEDGLEEWSNNRDSMLVEELEVVVPPKPMPVKHTTSLEIELKDKRVEALTRSPENLTIGSPIGNSTEIRETPAKSEDDSWKNGDVWVSFEKTPRIRKSDEPPGRPREDSYLSSSDSGEGEELRESFFDFSKEEQKRRSSGDVNGNVPYDLLAESNDSVKSGEPSPKKERMTSSTFEDVKLKSAEKAGIQSSIFGETSPTRGAAASPFDKIMPENLADDFTSPKEHGRFEKSRSCHSLNCQFCSPQRGQKIYKSEENKCSLPNLVSTALSTDPAAKTPKPQHVLYASGGKRQVPKKFTKTKSGRDPFGSFDDLTRTENDDKRRNDRPVRPSRLQSTTESTPSPRPLEKNEEKRKSADYAEVLNKKKAAPASAPKIEASAVRTSGNFQRKNSKRLSSTRKSGGRKQKAGPSKPYREVPVDGVVPVIKPRRNKNVNTTGDMSPREGMGGPEFLVKSRLPSIRLKAPARKKAKLLHRSEATSVQVVLLSGQKVEVACRTDSTASDVFDSVVTHTTLTEHYFFGLTILKDGEHFFLETDQKLHKFAPPGWKNQRKNVQAKNVYTLYLRLKYYPATLDYIKTDHTLHEMYLQLRRDIIDERLQVSRDDAYQLAALAIQAEYGDRPTESPTYFNTDHYMPHRHLMEELGGEERIRSNLAELHTQYSGMKKDEAETEYLKMCQNQREYGIHFHRLFPTKPNVHQDNNPLGDPDTGTPLWIGIMPKGIIILEEQSGARVPISQHPWHMTESLRFNRKRFIIIPANKGQSGEDAQKTTPPVKKIFYTDNYKKSSYFVKFAGTQHRFGMKMRGWAASLNSEQSGRSDSGLGAKGTLPQLKVPRNGVASISSSVKSNDSGVPDISREQSPDEKMAAASKAGRSPVVSVAHPVVPPRVQNRNSSNSGGSSMGVVEVNVPPEDRINLEDSRPMEESLSTTLGERLDEAEASGLSPLSASEYTVFTVNLTKDMKVGLGLTLVDGEIQGMKGVYVKSLTIDGPAETQGKLRIGDKLLAVNRESLEGKNRHDAVNLVKSSSVNVEMEILRLRGLYSSSEEDDSATTPSVQTATSSSVGRGRARTESDLSENLPPYSSQNIFDALREEMSRKDSADSPHIRKSETMPPGLDSGFLMEEDVRKLHPDRRALSSMTDKTRSTASSGRSSRASGEYQPLNLIVNDSGMVAAGSPQQKAQRAHSQGMYGGLDSSDSDEGGIMERKNFDKGGIGGRKHQSDSEDEVIEYDGAGFKGRGELPGFEEERRKMMEGSGMRDQWKEGIAGDIDWTATLDGDIGEIELEVSDEEVRVDDEVGFVLGDGNFELQDMEEVRVKLEKNEKGSLGIKIAGGSRGQKRVYIKALVSEPALSCTDLKPFDRLISVNGVDTGEMSHKDVVEVLKNASSPVTLGLLRPRSSGAMNGRVHSEEETEVKTLTVTLQKPSSGSLGLSLARPAGGEGIYIRVITPDSVAAEDKTLRIGDRLWEINGESVAKASPMEVVEKLKAAEGSVRLVVKRESSSLLH